MKSRFKWIFILLGFLLGIFIAFSIETGLFEIWHLIGKPPDEIAKIIGGNSNNVYVQTKSGDIYRFNYFNLPYNGGPASMAWEKETTHNLDLYPESHDSGYFITLPPLFYVSQSIGYYDYAGLENGGMEKFVIDPYGSVWQWSHFSAGMAAIVYPIFPIVGMVLGAFIALVWYVIQLILRRLKNR
jgi:hypothetical protein